MPTLQHCLLLLADCDQHLAHARAHWQAATDLSHRAQIMAHIDQLLDYRLVLMAARSALTSVV